MRAAGALRECRDRFAMPSKVSALVNRAHRSALRLDAANQSAILQFAQHLVRTDDDRAPSATPATSMSRPPITPGVTGTKRAALVSDDEHAGCWSTPSGAAARTTLCSGTVSTSARSLVTISASQVRPGRAAGRAVSSRTTTLNSRAARRCR